MRLSIVVCCLIAAVTAAPVPAFAGAGQPVGVMERPRPDYDAKGIRIGSFRLRPALDVGASSDDNIYRTSASKKSGVFITLNPSFSLTSDWSRHMLEITGNLKRYQYMSFGSEDRMDWFVGGDGRIDITRDAALLLNSSYSTLHEPRYSADEPGGAAEPTRYHALRGGGSLRYRPGRFGFELAGTYGRYTFDPTRLIGGGIYNNRDRNRDQYEATAKVSYEFSPGYAVFLRGAYDERRYDTAAGQTRNSKGYRAEGGAEMFLTHLIQGEIFVGFADQRFKAYPHVKALDYGARLTWYATSLMTFHLTAARSFDATTVAGASVSDDQSLGLSLDYELLRNLIIQAHGDFTDSRYVGTPRVDKLFEAGLTAKYLLNRYMAANAGYSWQHRISTVTGQGFTDNLFEAGLHFQL